MRLFVLVISVLCASSLTAETKALPSAVTTILNHKYPGWKLIQISPAFEQSRQQTLSYADEQIRAGAAQAEDFTGLDRLRRDEFQPSNRIFGDFDGDGMEDCVVAIKRIMPAAISIIAFLQPKAQGYRDVVLENVPIEADYTLMLAPKGDPMAGEAKGPETDYVRVDVPNAPAHWFVMQGGSFKRLDGPPEEAPTELPASTTTAMETSVISTETVETLTLPPGPRKNP